MSDENGCSIKNAHRLFVLMGVSGSGKSAVAQKISQQLDIPCLDGDFLHPRVNVDKMAEGGALDDSDRLPWLQAISEACYAMLRTNPTSLVVCSALKKSYRDLLRHGDPRISFIFLNGSHRVIEERMKQRKGHFFQPHMLDSQFAALEQPGESERDVMTIDIDRPLAEVVAECASWIEGHERGECQK
ncbi:gluconate kinase (SKI family) [Serratia fonticola]|uniref:Gluconokinase n=1 Tax=Serratia fonticola TaxID=47917 RepID=A0A542D693_SERFO|nr:gluconokinase, GntK/IdnK-type [Serratia fonticola]TQI79386.1 gluconate kinase (SKI family) [Serratia fonticola]TQI98589.1 gluconate kinase (SKI family) [Serratia fonticola]TVZ68117.1 gluconate kinase (SKI family) [Serratia fonticola]